MGRYLTEFIGTFFLVLTIGLTVVGGTELAPLAIGSVLMVMVYMGGAVSGAHYNPAVTLAAFLRGKLGAREILPYMVSQVLGAFAAAGVVVGITGDSFAPGPGVGVGAAEALAVELLFTFALCLVVLQCATTRETAGNSYFGLAIGFTLAVAVFAGGPLSGGAFNPAVGLGPSLMRSAHGAGSLGNLWIYLLGPFAGALAAVAFFKLQGGED